MKLKFLSDPGRSSRWRNIGAGLTRQQWDEFWEDLRAARGRRDLVFEKGIADEISFYVWGWRSQIGSSRGSGVRFQINAAERQIRPLFGSHTTGPERREALVTRVLEATRRLREFDGRADCVEPAFELDLVPLDMIPRPVRRRGRGRGHPPNERLQRIVHATMSVLEARGVQLSTSRTGVLVQVIRVILAALNRIEPGAAPTHDRVDRDVRRWLASYHQDPVWCLRWSPQRPGDP